MASMVGRKEDERAQQGRKNDDATVIAVVKGASGATMKAAALGADILRGWDYWEFDLNPIARDKRMEAEEGFPSNFGQIVAVEEQIISNGLTDLEEERELLPTDSLEGCKEVDKVSALNGAIDDGNMDKSGALVDSDIPSAGEVIEDGLLPSGAGNGKGQDITGKKCSEGNRDKSSVVVDSGIQAQEQVGHNTAMHLQTFKTFKNKLMLGVEFVEEHHTENRKGSFPIPKKIPTKTDSGVPCISFTDMEMETLTEDLKYTFVGKFSFGYPTMHVIQREFKSMKLKGDFSVEVVNVKHVLIKLDNEEDYVKVWERKTI